MQQQYKMLVSALGLVAIDFAYLSLIKDHFARQIAAVQGSMMRVNLFGAVITYVFLIFGLNYFIIRPGRSAQDAFLFLRIFSPPTDTEQQSVISFIDALQFVLPLMAIGLGFDSVNSEFNRRTLSRVLSQPLYRDALLIGKFLGGLATLAVALIGLWLIVFGAGLLLALAFGAAAFALSAWRQGLGVRVTAGVAAGLVALAPLLPFLLRPVLTPVLGPLHPTVLSLRAWQRVVTSEPLRLITGHGLETALRGKVVGMLPINAPASLLFEIWYELGIVGAFAAAFVLWNGIRHSGREHPVLTPGAMATAATAFASACLGIGTTASWWFTSVTVVVLVFIAAERGQFRTSRPKASALPPRSAA